MIKNKNYKSANRKSYLIIFLSIYSGPVESEIRVRF
jgi:hypothetical protein